jgi:hypothetical protein
MEDIIYNILTYFNLKVIIKCYTLNKIFNYACNQQLLWKGLTTHNYKNPTCLKNKWNDTYKFLHVTEKFGKITGESYDKIYDFKVINLGYKNLKRIPSG